MPALSVDKQSQARTDEPKGPGFRHFFSPPLQLVDAVARAARGDDPKFRDVLGGVVVDEADEPVVIFLGLLATDRLEWCRP